MAEDSSGGGYGSTGFNENEMEVARLLAEVEEKKEENVKLKDSVKELEEKLGSKGETLEESKRMMEEIESKKREEVNRKEKEISRLREAETKLKKELEELRGGRGEKEDINSLKDAEAKLKEEVKALKKKDEDRNNLEVETNREKEECEKLKNINDSLTKEINIYKEKEKAREVEFKMRENILASSLERSKEFDNLMDGVMNVGPENSANINDDPHISEEDLNRTILEDNRSENEEETEHDSEGADENSSKSRQKRPRESPINGEPTKKSNVGKVGVRIQYDGEGNFVSVPLRKEATEEGVVDPMDDGSVNEASKEKEIHEELDIETCDDKPEEPPPPVPPRSSSRSSSVGPPVSRLDKSPCDELDLLFPRMRRSSTRGIFGFDFETGKWENTSEGEEGKLNQNHNE